MTLDPAMSAAEYRAECERLGISVYRSAQVIGVHLRTAQSYASGERPVPRKIALLMRRLRKRDCT